MNTIPLSREGRWYRTRKPRLQIEILGCLVLRGGLSKKMIESIQTHHHHADILLACKNLEKEGLIEKDGDKWIEGRGRRQYLYRITEKGLRLLITDEPVRPLKFWKAVFGYFHHFNNKQQLTSEKVYVLFICFTSEYFKYKHHKLLAQLDSFQDMRDRWFKYLEQKCENDSKKVSIGQKIIEALAVRPKLTLRELSTEVGEVELDVNEVLSIYVHDSFSQPNFEEFGLIFPNMIDNNETDRKFNDKYHTDFLFHSLVKVNRTNQQYNYELTLFGVVLVLNLVRYHSINRLNNGLFYGNNLSFYKYFDKIASNYQNDIPLIFGKWKLLKEVLKSYAYVNFDIIDVTLCHSKRASIRRGGNREIFDGIEDIAKYQYQQLYDLVNAGQVVSFRYLTGISHSDADTNSRDKHVDYLLRNEINIDSIDLERLAPVYNLLMGLLLILSPVEYFSTKDQSSDLQPILTAPEILKIMEESFADQISALYYFNLFDEQEFESAAAIDRIRYSAPESLVPKECLYKILQNDVDGFLKDWFNRWKTDIANLQMENYNVLKSSV
jgi:hypothetical protein